VERDIGWMEPMRLSYGKMIAIVEVICTQDSSSTDRTFIRRKGRVAVHSANTGGRVGTNHELGHSGFEGKFASSGERREPRTSQNQPNNVKQRRLPDGPFWEEC
jgi:hypothetical protein